MLNNTGGFMLTYSRVIVSIILLLILVNFSFAQPMSGNYNVGSGQTYTSLTGASGFFNAVNTRGLNGNVTATITSNITENGSVSLNQWSGASYTITIQPSSASVKTLSGNVSSPLINLNGADNLTIDGRFGGSGRYLRFVNTNTGGQTFRFINDATNNTITYCIVDGMRVSSNSGIIDFSTTTGSTGNDNNTISYCTMKDASGGTLQNAIVSNGTTTSSARYNSGITIANNEIADVFRNAQTCSAILLLNGSTDFTITGNSIYQTTTQTPTNATHWNVINVNTSVANNIVISNNYLGGSSANCGGSAWTISGNASNSLYFIRMTSVGSSTASTIDGNTIANINISSRPSSSGVAYFGGIIVESGIVNVGTITGNIIGNNTGNSSITLSYSGTTSNIINRGIVHSSRGNISNNIVGSFDIGGTNNQMIRLECIYYSGTPSSNITINDNIVGSSSVSNSIQQISSTFALQLTGIHTQVNTILVTISGNIVSNMRVTSNSSSSRIRGIYHNRSTTASLSITNNTISELYCASSASADANRYPDNTSLIGLFTGSSSATQTISGNTISGLYGTDNSDSYVMGFGYYNNTAKGTFENNRIYNLNHSSTTGSAKIWGINAFWGSWNIFNNQISITNGEATDNQNSVNINNSKQKINDNNNLIQIDASVNEDVSRSYLRDVIVPKIDADKGFNNQYADLSTNGVIIKGIHDEAEFPSLFYYNTIYIGGSASGGSASSWAYDRPLLDWATDASLRNNLFFNARTGGTGFHYAIGNEVGYENWTGTSADYNVYIAPNANAVAIWGSTNQNIYQWRDSCFGDKHTWSTTTSVISASNLFSNIAAGNLNINTGNWEAWLVSGKGIAIAGSSSDYNGNSRPTTVAGGCSDIGSHEFTATPPNNPSAAQDNSPGSGVTSNYTLWGRTLITINWGTGGSSYPSSVNVQYYSGVSHSGVLGGGYSNSYWSINPTGLLTGTTYNITINFGQHETYSISSPSANTRIAKYNGTWEVFSTPGTGVWESELNWASELITTRGMNSFSDYSLTDATAPLPVELCSFTANVVKRQADLYWTTCSEINNRGFEIERRIYQTENSNYSAWNKVGFIEGNGTTNEQRNYKYSDLKLSTGKYQYRLKQIDFNGSFEYHNLSSPSEVIIGTPIAADLFQNYPNPSNPTSKVDFQIPFSAKVTLKVYDITGKEVQTILEKNLESGYYTSEFNGSNLASGVYFYRIYATGNDGNSFTKTMKLILVK